MLSVIFAVLLVFISQCPSLAGQGAVKVKKEKPEAVTRRKSTPQPVKQQTHTGSMSVKTEGSTDETNFTEKLVIRRSDGQRQAVTIRTATPYRIQLNEEVLASILKFQFQDSILFGIHKLQRLDNQKYLKTVLIVCTDGQDTTSSQSLEDVIDVASAAAIPIVTIAAGNADTEVLERISNISNGLYFYASDTAALEGIYDAISKIVRGAYLLSFPSATTSGDRVEVEITTPLKDHKQRWVKFSGQYVTP